MRPTRLVCLVFAVCSCGGTQTGSYGACDEPAGLALGCEDEIDDPELSPTAACRKLAACGVVLVSDEVDDAPDPLDLCVAEIEDAADAQGDLVLVCIEETSCPDLARASAESVEGDDPNPGNAEIEGVLGLCGRFDPR